MPKNVIVKEDQLDPIGVEVMAEAIVNIGDAMKRISRSRLKRKALVILVCKDSGAPQYQVEAVLESLDNLEKTYLNPKVGGKNARN